MPLLWHDREMIASLFFSLLVVMMFLSGCSTSPPVVPEALESQIETDLAFDEVKRNPDSSEGKLVVIGGQVLSARRLQTGTQLEVLQLPLKSGEEPVRQLTQSGGRFLALEKDFLDPAQLPPGTRITLVGRVTGSTTQKLDEADYQYPTFDIEHLHVWQPDPYEDQYDPGPRWSIFGGGGSGGRVGGGVGIGIGF